MSVRPLLAALLLLPLLPVAPGSLADSPFPQDDAGSGADAPDLFEEALPLNGLTSFEGRLFTTPQGQLTGSFLDREDWYKFHVGKGQKITFRFWGLQEDPLVPPESVHPNVDVWNPAGYRVGHAGIPGWFITDSKGMWRMRAFTGSFTGSEGMPYHIEFTVQDMEGKIAAGFSETTSVVAGFELGPGGRVLGKHWVSYWKNETAATTLGVVDFNEELTDASAARGSGPGFVVGAHAHVGDAAITTPFLRTRTDSPNGFMISTEGLIFFKPGRYHIASLTRAPATYVWYEFELQGNVTFLGETHVSRDRGIVLHQYDFRGGAAVMAPQAAYAGALVSASVPIKKFMIGIYDCSGLAKVGCRAEKPTGESVPLPPSGGWLLGQDRGEWRFYRDAEVQPVAGESNLLTAVDVGLPEGGPSKEHPKRDHGGKPDHPGKSP